MNPQQILLGAQESMTAGNPGGAQVKQLDSLYMPA
jgi:hypothetical protein